ncbi:hypothetical protein PAHAL_6G052100 [Panicum hallii]|jgi:hypothetical protein|uniref:Uncharacterized protein n=1 Tax=Panicum hallii TaxID=206008 RepID=A0A2T8IF85_9POAL|nr:hypothetical protein PAHAL_6G052100 [Panicum hallii]
MILHKHSRIRGAMVARLTPDQKVACSIHVGFKPPDPSPDIFCSSKFFVHRILHLVSSFGLDLFIMDAKNPILPFI